MEDTTIIDSEPIFPNIITKRGRPKGLGSKNYPNRLRFLQYRFDKYKKEQNEIKRKLRTDIRIANTKATNLEIEYDLFKKQIAKKEISERSRVNYYWFKLLRNLDLFYKTSDFCKAFGKYKEENWNSFDPQEHNITLVESDGNYDYSQRSVF